MNCPFCGEEMKKLEPEVVKTCFGTYTSYKAICCNVAKHYGNGKIIVPYKGEKK